MSGHSHLPLGTSLNINHSGYIVLLIRPDCDDNRDRQINPKRIRYFGGINVILRLTRYQRLFTKRQPGRSADLGYVMACCFNIACECSMASFIFKTIILF